MQERAKGVKMDIAPHNLMYITWSLPQLLIVLLLVVLLFGKGKVSDLMGDVAKGIKSFKKGLSDEDTSAAAAAQPPAQPKPLDSEAVKAEVKTPSGTETKA
jgi:sec-independent protein translocase protein TatA